MAIPTFTEVADYERWASERLLSGLHDSEALAKITNKPRLGFVAVATGLRFLNISHGSRDGPKGGK
jgi:hypothetical protein